MAINLLPGKMNTVPQGFTGPASFAAPLGVTAKIPAVNTPSPSPTIPKSQQNPITPIAPSVPQTKYNEQGQSIGTQHPGMSGFVDSSQLPVNGKYPAGSTQNVQTQPLQQTQAIQPQPIQTPPDTTFSGLLRQAVTQQNSPFNQAAMGSIYGTQGASQNTYGQGSAVANNTEQQAEDAVRKLQGLQNAVAQGEYNIETTPMLGQFQQGREQALQKMYGGQEQALASEIQGLGGLYGTAAGQQAAGISGLNSAGNTALTGQSQTYGALNNAANLAQPQLGSIGQVPFNPQTQDQGTVLGSTQPGGLAAAGNLLGQYQGAQALGAAPYQGAAQGIQATGAVGGTIAANQAQQIAGYKSAQQQGQNLASQLSDLIQTFGLNPSDVNAVNAGIQKIAQNTSSPQYQILSNYLNDVASRYAQILTPPGGSATDTTRAIAAGMLNATASGKSIQAVLESLDQQANAVIQGIPSTGNVPNTQGQNYTNGSTVSAGGYDFVYQNGKWIPK